MVFESVIESTLLSLRQLHNTLLPAHKLPNEILRDIFESVNGSVTGHISNAVELSSVCQRWRDTAISVPSLWTDTLISFEASDVQDLFLERSASAPLNVTLEVPLGGGYGDDYKTFLNKVVRLAEQSDRILSIKIDSQYNREEAFDDLTFPAPLLKRFSCITRMDSDDEDSGSDDPDMPILLQDNLFDKQTPSLRSVELKDVHWMALESFSNLTDLSLSTYIWRSSPCWQLDELLDVLDRCPLMERLDLRGFRFQSYVSPRSKSTVSLEKLSTLTLLQTESSKLQPWLDCPNITKYFISNQRDELSFFLPEDPSLLNFTRGFSWLVITVEILEDDKRKVKVKGGAPKIEDRWLSPTYYIRSRPAIFTLLVEDVDESSDIIKDIWNYISTVSLSNLSELEIEWPLSNWSNPPCEEEIHDFYDNLPNLRLLYLTQYGCDALITPFAADTDLCPRLEFISARISYDGLTRTFHALNSVALARAAVVKCVRFWYFTTAESGGRLERQWSVLYEKHAIKHEALDSESEEEGDKESEEEESEKESDSELEEDSD